MLKVQEACQILTPLILFPTRSKINITVRSDFMGSIQISPVRLVANEWYATRTSTVLLVRRDGLVRWWEKDIYVLSPQSEPIRGEAIGLKTRHFTWQIE
jgi:uncharacterized protein with NRDE domain